MGRRRLGLRDAAIALLRGAYTDRDEVTAFRRQRLRELFDHAVARVAHYRDAWVGLRLPPGAPLDELLAAIPVSRKSNLQTRDASDLVAGGLEPDRLVVHTTSGSTGRPYTIRRSQLEERLLLAFRLRANLSLGLRPFDRRARVTFVRSPAGFAPSAEPPQPWFSRLGLLRQQQIHCLLPTEQILDRLRRLRPESLGGYPSTLAAVARLMAPGDRETLRPRLLWTAGETLTAAARTEIERGFAVRVFDQYAAHEANLLAVECRETGLLHVVDEAVILEVLREGRPAAPGEEGEVVITPLHSFAMPLLRFALGDVAVRGPTPCTCGAHVSTLTRVVGRTVDFFRSSDGSLFHPYRLAAPLLAAAPWLRQFQVAQEGPGLVVVRAVPLASPSEEQLQAARRVLGEAAGERFTVRLDVVATIPLSPGGKAQPYSPAPPHGRGEG